MAGSHRARTRFFLWVHLFEPHAPYGTPAHRRPGAQRYADEVAEADRAGRPAARRARADRARQTLIVVAADHGEAFGEHGEIGHSIFVYDTTLRVPLIVARTGRAAGARVAERRVADRRRADGPARCSVSGVRLPTASISRPRSTARALPTRELYAESFAPLLDFGWSPLRSSATGGWKYIAAPRPELYRRRVGPGRDRRTSSSSDAPSAAALDDRVDRVSSAPTLTPGIG